MKQLKCNNCGATIEITDEDKDFAICPYCKAKYQLNETKNINIKIDDNTKELLTNGFNIFKNSSKIAIIPIIIFFMIVITLIITITINIFKQVNKQNNSINNTIETKENTTTNEDDTINNIKDKINKSFFNSPFESYSGTKSKFLTEPLLDKIVTNNKTNKDMLVTLIYKDKETTDPDTIIEIKHSLNDKTKYEIKIDYDEEGYVNKVTIEDI